MVESSCLSSPIPLPPAAEGDRRGQTGATLVSDDPQLAERLIGALAPELGLTVVPLTASGDTGPLRLSGGEPALIDLHPRPERAAAAIAPLRVGMPDRVVLALCDAAQGLTAVRQALALGADDFCRRDAPAWELRLRLEMLATRRMSSAADELAPLVVGDLELDPRTRMARRRGQRLRLSGRQFELLRVLMQHPGEPLSQARLLAEMGLSVQERGSNVIEVHVYHLRRQIGGERLSTVRGIGYVLHALDSAT